MNNETFNWGRVTPLDELSHTCCSLSGECVSGVERVKRLVHCSFVMRRSRRTWKSSSSGQVISLVLASSYFRSDAEWAKMLTRRATRLQKYSNSIQGFILKAPKIRTVVLTFSFLCNSDAVKLQSCVSCFVFFGSLLQRFPHHKPKCRRFKTLR